MSGLTEGELCEWVVEEREVARIGGGHVLQVIECHALASEVLVGWDTGERVEMALCVDHATEYRADPNFSEGP